MRNGGKPGSKCKRREEALPQKPNPTNGSWWMVQIPPESSFGGNAAGSEVSTNCRWLELKEADLIALL